MLNKSHLIIGYSIWIHVYQFSKKSVKNFISSFSSSKIHLPAKKSKPEKITQWSWKWKIKKSTFGMIILDPDVTSDYLLRTHRVFLRIHARLHMHVYIYIKKKLYRDVERISYKYTRSDGYRGTLPALYIVSSSRILASYISRGWTEGKETRRDFRIRDVIVSRDSIVEASPSFTWTNNRPKKLHLNAFSRCIIIIMEKFTRFLRRLYKSRERKSSILFFSDHSTTQTSPSSFRNYGFRSDWLATCI